MRSVTDCSADIRFNLKRDLKVPYRKKIFRYLSSLLLTFRVQEFIDHKSVGASPLISANPQTEPVQEMAVSAPVVGAVVLL